MRDETVVALSLDHTMQMGRTIGILVQGPQHVAHWAIRWHWVTTWFDGAQPKTSLCVSLEHRPELHLLPFGVLDIIEAVCTRLPDVHRRSSNRLALSRLDQCRDKTWLAGYPLSNVGPMGEMRRPVEMERAK